MSNKDGFKIQPVDFLRTENQVGRFEGFATGAIHASVDVRMSTDSLLHTPRLAAPPAWMRDADCLGKWNTYDEPGVTNLGPPSKRDVARLKTLCGGCKVKDICLESAMEEEGTVNGYQRFGVRGGLGPKQRAALSRERQAETEEVVA